jgi:hypothetical protein
MYNALWDGSRTLLRLDLLALWLLVVL